MTSDWQSMETAPKDGRGILVGRLELTTPWVVFWVFEKDPSDGHWFLSNSPDGECVFDATHWMPLPPSPCSSQDKTDASIS